MFHYLVELEHLDLSHNQISVIQDGAFDNLSKLRLLLLHDNLLPAIPSTTLKSVTKLAELSIGGNSFEKINPGDLSYLRFLFSLDLSGTNLVTGLSSESFNNLSGLRILKLDACNLDTVPTEPLKKLIRLEELHLSRNMIVEIPANVFSANKRLRIIKISGCPKLERISKESFTENLDLQNITISKNKKLKYLQPGTFYLSELNTLDLHGNNLEQISKDLAMWNDIRNWYIHDNPLVCNCSISWLWKSLKDANSSSGPDVLCYAPKSIKDRSLTSLTHNDLSCGLDPATQGLVIGLVVFFILVIAFAITLLILCRKSGSCVNRLLKGHKLGGGSSRENGTFPRDPYHGYILAPKPVPVTEL